MSRCDRVWILLLAVAIPCTAAIGAQTSDRGKLLLVEAESFADRGGWVVDQQFMDQMGSPFLLAHGLGVPVKDASASVTFPAPGRYRVFVRTRDWVATWKVPGAPGKFQLLVNGQALKTVFGTEGAAWHWQSGGTVEVPQAKASLALHDLTGFEGRCDAILFVADEAFTPPDAGPELKMFRRWAGNYPSEPEAGGQFDVVVVGGGMAGCCAAVSAARLGCKTALIHDRPVLGGNNSSEVRVGNSGKVHQEPFPRLGDLVEEIGPIGYHEIREARRNPDDPKNQKILAYAAQCPEREKIHNAGPAMIYEDGRKEAVVRGESQASLFLNLHVIRAEVREGRIAAVVARHIETGRDYRFTARWFVDCTGDGTLGYLAGAEWRMGREPKSMTNEERAPDEADQLVMGTSVQWYTAEESKPSAFPDCPWALRFSEDSCQRTLKGDWDWETGMQLNQVDQFEQVRDHAFRATYGNWAFLKNHTSDKAKYANYRLDWVAYVGGKRESRRLMGDVILQQQDVVDARPYPDASVTTTWSIDLHFPAPACTKYFPGEEFRSVAKHTKIKPYPIPYRCLYSRNISNLFMAGRNISVTHVALGTIRVQKTTGMMGEVVGMAASLCKKHDTDPRGVYAKHLGELVELMKRGVGQEALRLPAAK